MEGSAGCSLCCRAYARHDLRRGLAGQPSDLLCAACWQVCCAQPWPADDSAHGAAAYTAFAAAAAAAPAAPSAATAAPTAGCRRARSMMDAPGAAVARGISASSAAAARGIATSAPRRLPASVPEDPRLLAGASGSGDPRWGALAAAASAPARAPGALGAAPRAGSFPGLGPAAALRNVVDEQCLELFEQQAHLLDPRGREALARQREFLQWQGSLEGGAGGALRSAAELERQDSAGSGTAAGEGGGGREAADDAATRGGGSDGSGGAAEGLRTELERARAALGAAARERAALGARLAAAESEAAARRAAALCGLCREAPRNCVVLPCMHLATCADCARRRAALEPSCPVCHAAATGFQTVVVP